MFGRRHYNFLAAELRKIYADSRNKQEVEIVVRKLARALHRDNENFKEGKFLEEAF